MASSSTYDGFRQVNACYHSVIEDVTRSLQTLLEDEKEEEKKRLKKILEEKKKTLKAKIAGDKSKGRRRAGTMLLLFS